LIKRISYSLQMLYRYRRLVANVYLNSPKHYQISQLSPASLKQHGIKVLALDFDGVLSAHGAAQPLEALFAWLQECVEVFGVDRVFILSNKPMPVRIAFFAAHFQGLQMISGVRKKPYPDGLQRIAELTGEPANSIMLVDDRLLTGVLAACIAQTQVTYITYPYANFSRKPVQESFFWSLRFLERRLLQSYCWLHPRGAKTPPQVTQH